MNEYQGDESIVNLRSEYGSSANVNWPTTEEVTMYDKDGNVSLCKCGNKATSGIISANAYINYCKKCSPIGY